MQSTQWFLAFLHICLHQAFPELHNIHDSFSRLHPIWHFTKPLTAYFYLCACIRHMPEQDNWPNGFLCFCSMLASDIRPNCTDYQCLCLPLYLWRFYAVPIYMCIYMFASGIYPNDTAYTVVNTDLLEIFSLLGTFKKKKKTNKIYVQGYFFKKGKLIFKSRIGDLTLFEPIKYLLLMPCVTISWLL